MVDGVSYLVGLILLFGAGYKLGHRVGWIRGRQDGYGEES